MSRIKIELPQTFHFSTELPIRISDINYEGHLGNDAVLSLVHEARVRFLKHLGYAELNIEGVGIIMGDAAVVYREEGFYGDTLVIDVAVGEFGNASCDFYYRLTNKESGKEVARIKTGIVFYDYGAKKTVAVPAGFSKRFTA